MVAGSIPAAPTIAVASDHLNVCIQVQRLRVAKAGVGHGGRLRRPVRRHESPQAGGIVPGSKIVQSRFRISFFARELVAGTYSLARIRRRFLANKLPAQGLADFDAANVPQRRWNTSPKSSLDCDLEGPRVQAEAFVRNSRNEVVRHRIYVI